MEYFKEMHTASRAVGIPHSHQGHSHQRKWQQQTYKDTAVTNIVGRGSGLGVGGLAEIHSSGFCFLVANLL